VNKALLLYATGDAHMTMHRLSLPSKAAWAARHGYRLVDFRAPLGNRHPSWAKVAILRELLSEYETAVFLGADTWIAPDAPDIVAGMPDEALQALVVHDIDSMPGTPRVGYVPNCDVWVVRRGMEPWLEQMDAMGDLAAHPWWEQAACMRLMGWDIAHPCVRVRPSDLWQRTFELDGRWNHHPYAKCLGTPWLEHATGFPIEERLRMMRTWAGV
jgi:hypothetical protein